MDNQSGLSVIVEDYNIEKAIRNFKKKVDRSGIIKELQARQEFIKPGQKKRLKRKKAIWQKESSR